MSSLLLKEAGIRQDFPVLHQNIHGKPLIYLDSGATAQKPQAVIDAMTRYYERDNASVHRGVYTLSERATVAYETARQTVQRFIHAPESREIIFTRGTTEAINLVATSLGSQWIRSGDEIILSEMEHHSNIVPWQMLCERTGALLKVIPVNDEGSLDLKRYGELLNERVRLVGLIHVSNVLGTINPIQEMIAMAHQYRIPVLIDGAQAVAHHRVDVQALDCDFYAFSGHKLYGPTGIGVLYGKSHWLDAMPPYQGGGAMIQRVSFAKTDYQSLPYKFEAGTPAIAEAIGLAAAIDYVHSIGWDSVVAHEVALTCYARDILRSIPGLRLIGEAPQKTGVISFVMAQAHPHDIGTVLDHEGVAIRAGHHCAMPLMERFGVPATARVSLGLYNDARDIEGLVAALYKVVELFG
ncbi:MAG: cysteine sulfinate desulfinase [Coxiella sp. RIFCSPHIGHO2_12_FULL_44_14]|nr:MAG: cysteine sulfinate desulfinase [Coxiella sp. RIFCSPHIGHO2_12_FULL_44_14]